MEKKRRSKKPKLYVIGVDAGGTKTDVALADLRGKILAITRPGSASPRNLGIEESVFNIAKGIKEVLKKTRKGGKIISTFVALPSIEEEYKERKGDILEKLKEQKGISKILKGKILIGSDQIAAFRSGTKGKDGVLLIAGTGCVAHGWKGEKEAKISGWGWLADEGSAFWVGQKVFQTILKNLDKRGSETFLTELAFREFKTKDKIELLKRIYSQNPTEIVPKFSIICDKASKKGDRIAKRIMAEAGKELALAAKKVIQELKFQRIKFPLVLIGSMFKSKIVLNKIKKDIKKIAPKAQFIRPREGPVRGAIRLAIDDLKWK